MEEHVPLERRLSWTVAGAARVAGLPEGVIRAAVREGRLNSFTIGSSTRRIRRADLVDWLDSL